MNGESKFSKSQIAHLVLGYLKQVNCFNAYNEFLRESRFFCAEEKQSPKYVITRIGGLSLIDILVEYAEINTIVQKYLEPTSFYKERDCRSSLLKKLTYLLDKIQYSRPSSPRSPASVSTCITNDSSDVDATPIDSLPGNKQCHGNNAYNSKASRRKITTRQGNHRETSSLDDLPTPDKEEISEVLTQTLLESKELHEKLAENINTVLSTPEALPKRTEKKNDKNDFPSELDATVKTVVQKTEEDPIFDKLMSELMGLTEPEPSPSSSTAHSSKPAEGDKSSTKNSYKSPEKSQLNDHNAEAVQNLMLLAQSQPLNSNMPKNDHVPNVSNSEIIVFDGSLENFIKSSNVPNTSRNDSIVLAPSKPLLLLTPQQPVTPRSSVITKEDILAMPTVIVNDSPIKQSQSINGAIPKVTSTAVVINNPTPIRSDVQIIQTPSTTLHVPNKKDTNKDRKGVGGRRKSQPIIRSNPPVAIQPAPNPVTAVVFSGFPQVEPMDAEPCLPKELGLQPISAKSANKAANVIKSLKTPAKQIENTISKVTPKSGSHVRNLNFSTPPKLRTSEMQTRSQTSASPKKDKENNVKCDKLKEKSTIDVKSNPNSKTLSTWDADLRALTGTLPTNNDSGPKRKRKSPAKSRKKIKKSSVSEQETKMLEDALKSPEQPLKSDNITNSAEKILKITEKALKVTEENQESIEGSAKGSKTNTVKKKRQQKQKNNKGTNKIEKNTSKEKNIRNDDEVDKESIVNLVTPEIPKDPVLQPINKACRNIMPMLETPIKCDILPKTPGKLSPTNLASFTPYNKILEAELGSVDLSSINTPIIPITPNFPPITPNIVSPYSNRPTDYSTSSSYYIPSDSEQNKNDLSLKSDTSPEKIDQVLIKECQRLENLEKGEEKIKILSNIVIKKEIISVNNHLKTFNKNIIGKKNLSLVSRRSNSSPSSDSESGEIEDGSPTVWDESQSNTTVICPPKNEVVSTYSLRNRSVKKNVEKSKDIDTETVKDIINSTDVQNLNSKRKNQNHKDVLKELEEKRRRTIKKFKATSSSTPKRNNKTKTLKNIVNKVSPVPSITTKRNKRKSNSPRKSVMKEYSDDDEDDEAQKKLLFEEKHKSASDVEAENLIHGLKERGIHLMQNKTPKKNTEKLNKSRSSLEKLKEDLNLTEESLIQEDDPQFDHKVYEQEDFSFIYDEKKSIVKKIKDYDTSMLDKILDANINGNNISLTCSKFDSLLDIVSEINILVPKRYKTIRHEAKVDTNTKKEVSNNMEIICDSPASSRIDPSENDLMNYAVVGSVREENSDDGTYSPKNLKKKSSVETHKKDEQCVEIIRKINVEDFLNSVHGKN